MWLTAASKKTRLQLTGRVKFCKLLSELCQFEYWVKAPLKPRGFNAPDLRGSIGLACEVGKRTVNPPNIVHGEAMGN